MTASALKQTFDQTIDADFTMGRGIAAYFSSPELKAEAKLPKAMIGEYARALYQMAFEQASPALAQLCPSIFNQLDAIIGQALPWGAAWHPDLAEIERLLPLSLSGAEMWEALAPMMVRFAAEGVLEEGEIILQTPKKCFWGNLKLPEADRIVFTTKLEQARIQLFRGDTQIASVTAQREPSGIWRSDDVPSVGIVWLDKYPILVWTPADERGYPHPGKRNPLPNALAEMVPVMAEATKLLAENCPDYIPWIADVMRNIVPLDGSDGIRMSASIEEFPGLTFLSFPNPAVELAEALAHEASHHHLLALRRLTPLHDGTDKKQYFSPIKKTGRPIELILYAFHAFANAAIYHRNLVRNGHQEYHSINGRTLTESLERIQVMHTYLAETPALTEAGETLWKPLAECLFSQ